MHIRFIKAVDTHPIRHRVLRPHQPIEEVDFPNDRNPDSFHVGAYVGDVLVGVASFYGERHEALKGWKPYRLRGMATLEEYRGKGIGSKLLRFAIDHLRNNKADLLWCQARTVAKAFYEREGLQASGEPFVLGDIGEHWLMARPL